MKKMKQILCFTLCLSLFLGLGNGNYKVNAANSANTDNCTTIVDDINATNGLKYENFEANGDYITINVDKTSLVRIWLNNVSAAYEDSDGLPMATDMVTKLYYDQKTSSSLIGEITVHDGEYGCIMGKKRDDSVLALNPGTYKLKLDVKDGYGNCDVAIEKQEVGAIEPVSPSSKANPNLAEIGQSYTGFLADTDSADYYKIVLKEDSIVDLSYRLDCINDGYISMRSEDNEEVIGDRIDTNFKWTSFRSVVEKGTYYINISSESGYGKTEFKVLTTPFSMKLTPSTTKLTNKDVTVSINSYSGVWRMVYVPYTLTKSDLKNEELWNKYVDSEPYDILDEKKFSISKNGYYSVMTEDTTGARFLRTIHITNIDKSAPTIPTVSAQKGSKVISGTGEAGAMACVIFKGKTYQTKISTNKKFTITLPAALSESDSAIVYVKDAAGNSSKQKVIAYAPISPVVNIAKPTGKVISGVSTPNSTVYATVSGKTYSAKTNANGAFKINVKALKEGSTISLYTKNANGQSAAIKKVIAPKVPKLKAYKKKTKKITGTALKNSTVVVTIGKKTYKKKVSKKGKFTITLKAKLKKKTKIKVYTKFNGVSSTTKTYKVK